MPDDMTLVEMVEAAPDYEPDHAGAVRVSRTIEDIISGKRQAIKFPWPLMSKLTRAMTPGTVTMISGMPGATKTLMLTRSVWHWHEQGHIVAYYALEDNREFHLMRALAQYICDSRITDPEWVKANPDMARSLASQHKEWQNSVGACIHEKPRNRVSLKDVSQWVTEQAKIGTRIVIIDPLSGIDAGNNRWVADGAFMDSIKIAAEDYNMSVLIVNHLDTLSGTHRGGQIYGQLCHTVMTIKAQDAMPMRCVTTSMTRDMQVNRLLYIEKSRLAGGTGQTIGYWFNRDTLDFEECGVVQLEKRRGKRS